MHRKIYTHWHHDIVLVAIMLTAIMLVVGCQGSGVSGAKVGVSGTVKIGGKPLSYAVVEFQSNDFDEVNRQVRVMDGKFVADEALGLVEGDYTVRVLPFEPEVEELAQFTFDMRKQMSAVRSLIPAKYQQAGALNATLSADEDNVVNLDLKS